MTDNQVKIMKLSSGEEIVSELITEENPKSFGVRSPLKLLSIPRMESGGVEESVSLQRWIHFAEDKDVNIPKAQVLAMANASYGLSKFYEYCVLKLENQAYSEDEYGEYDEEEDWDEDEELLDELESPSKLIH
jgi:hypothetical protein